MVLALKNRADTHVAMVATSAVAGTILLGWAWHGLRRRLAKQATLDNDNKYGDELDPPTNAENNMLFPWEPKGGKQHIYGPGALGSSSRGKEKELDFLASMTFANGGLRAPNCLCCF